MLAKKAKEDNENSFKDHEDGYARLLLLKKRLFELQRQSATLQRSIDVAQVELSVVNSQILDTEEELHSITQAPVPNGVDPTEWLPDEILIHILLQVVFVRACGLVCRRWHTLMQANQIQRQIHKDRWILYSMGDKLPRGFEAHTDYVRSLALSADESKVFTASDDGTIKIWSSSTGRHLRTLEGHNDWVMHVLVSPDDMVFSACFDGSVGVWSGDNYELTMLDHHTRSVRALAFGDGKLFTGSTDRTICMWSPNTHKLVATLRGHENGVLCLVVCGQQLVSGCTDGAIRVWSVADGSSMFAMAGHKAPVTGLVLGQLTGTVVSASHDCEICVWSMLDGSLLTKIHEDHPILSIAVSKVDGTMYSSTRPEGLSVRLRGSQTCTHKIHHDYMTRLAIAKNGTLYSISSNSVQMW